MGFANEAGSGFYKPIIPAVLIAHHLVVVLVACLCCNLASYKLSLREYNDSYRFQPGTVDWQGSPDDKARVRHQARKSCERC
jgi:hypothetical protein